MAAREGRLNGFRLYGVALLSRGNGAALPGTKGVSVLRFRDLGALVQQSPYTRAACSPGDLESHRTVVDAAFARGTVLPAPCGTLFRGSEQVRHWLERNYIALNEGLHFVAGRCEARVYVSRSADEAVSLDESKAAIDAAVECFRLLGRGAVATLSMPPRVAPPVLGHAYLIEQDRWSEFSDQVREQALRCVELAFQQTGPWPPYDFVRMDFRA